MHMYMYMHVKYLHVQCAEKIQIVNLYLYMHLYMYMYMYCIYNARTCVHVHCTFFSFIINSLPLCRLVCPSLPRLK